MPVTEDRTIRLDRDALAAALSAETPVAPEEVVLDPSLQTLRAPGADGAVRDVAGAALAVLVMRYLARLRIPVARDASKRVSVAEDAVSLILRRVHPAPARPGA